MAVTSARLRRERRLVRCLLVGGAAAGCAAVAGCGAAAERQTAALDHIPVQLVAEARPIGRAPRFHPPARGPVIGRCRHRRGPRDGVHVEVFAANRVVLLPAGLSARPPFSYASGRIAGARCFGALATLDPTGLVLVRPSVHLTSGDLFRAWGQPLSAHRLLSFTAAPHTRVTAYVNGRLWKHPPGSVPLTRHTEIVFEVGPHVPPHHSYTFPPGL